MRKNFYLFLSVPLLIIASGFSQSDAKLYYESGVNSIKKKDFIKAIGDFTNAISLKTDFAEAYLERANAKTMLAEQIGFVNTESCFDLIKALSLGLKDATSPLEKNCMGECFNTKSALIDPEQVLCADFSSKILTDLPDGSDKLTNCIRLSMYNNRMTTLSPKFESLKSVIHLDLSSNKITELPPGIAKMKYLDDLNLNKNLLQELPVEFGTLDNLQNLYIRQNQLTHLPKSIARLQNLEVLDLSLNKITSMPIELANLKKLRDLRLVGNEISKKEQAKILALVPPTCKVYFE